MALQEVHAQEGPLSINGNTGNFEYAKCDPTGKIIVTEDSMPLRAVWLIIEGKISCECLLDGGSQMVRMNENVWKKIGNNLRIQECVEMQAANSGRTLSNGRLENVKFTFGDIDIFLQVQVMTGVPYDVLLGQPFTALTKCVTHEWRNSDAHITIWDPNSDTIITIPTRRRIQQHVAQTDF